MEPQQIKAELDLARLENLPTLRDQFAMAATYVVSIGVIWNDNESERNTKIARDCYAIADAMLAARTQEPEG